MPRPADEELNDDDEKDVLKRQNIGTLMQITMYEHKKHDIT